MGCYSLSFLSSCPIALRRNLCSFLPPLMGCGTFENIRFTWLSSFFQIVRLSLCIGFIMANLAFSFKDEVQSSLNDQDYLFIFFLGRARLFHFRSNVNELLHPVVCYLLSLSCHFLGIVCDFDDLFFLCFFF